MNFTKTLIILIASFNIPLLAYAQLDDPTRPPGYRLILPSGKTAAKEIGFNLSSIRISASKRTAIINDRSVVVGDKVNGASVIGIYPSDVKLKKYGKLFTVRLLSRISKKAVSR
ncbi:MAG: hypothetical protein QM484_07370 [Woeseiaceae bacterium]